MQSPAIGQPASGPWSRPVVIAAAALLLVALWLLAHPYRGIRHDGSLYLGQALLQISPEALSHDLFFVFGSQDRYSTFSSVYAWLIGLFGVGPTARGLLIGTQLAFAGALYLLLSRLFRAPLLWFCFAAVCCFPAYYGGFAVFSYAENFLTARSLAEPFLLLALWCLLKDRMILAALLCGAAGLLHPLLAIPVFLLGWIHLSLRRPAFWAAALLGAIVPVLALAGVAPFDALFRAYDEDWLGVVERRNAFVLISNWAYFDWARLAFDATIAALAARLFSGTARRLYIAAILTAALGVGMGALGADVLANVLLTSLQTWRAHWMLHLLAMAALPFVLHAAWQQGPNGRLAAGLILVEVFGMRFPGAMAGLGLAVYLLLVPAGRIELSQGLRKVLLWTALAVAGVGAADQIALNHHSQVDLRGDPPELFLVSLLAFPAVAGLFVASGALLMRRSAAVALALALCLATTGLAFWDQRSPWLRYMEDVDHTANPFSRVIAPDKQVYWFKELLASWVVLRRASYFAPGQGSGALFNRGNALEYERRLDAVKPLEFQESTCLMMAILNGDRDSCGVTEEAAGDVCREAKELDYLILENTLAIPPLSSWEFRPAEGRERNFHLYDCTRLRKL